MAALKCKRGASTLLSETLATLLVWMLQMTSSCAAVTLADGVYEVSLVVVDGVEQQQVKYVGEANTTLGSWAASAERPARGGGGGRKLLADSGVHCQWDANMNSVDLSNAINGLANYFGSGRYWSSNYNVVVGSAVAYACNYGGQQYTVGGMVYSDEFDVDDACANYVGGWYAHESWKSSFGRTVNGWGFC